MLPAYPMSPAFIFMLAKQSSNISDLCGLGLSNLNIAPRVTGLAYSVVPLLAHLTRLSDYP